MRRTLKGETALHDVVEKGDIELRLLQSAESPQG